MKRLPKYFSMVIECETGEVCEKRVTNSLTYKQFINLFNRFLFPESIGNEWHVLGASARPKPIDFSDIK